MKSSWHSLKQKKQDFQQTQWDVARQQNNESAAAFLDCLISIQATLHLTGDVMPLKYLIKIFHTGLQDSKGCDTLVQNTSEVDSIKDIVSITKRLGSSQELHNQRRLQEVRGSRMETRRPEYALFLSHCMPNLMRLSCQKIFSLKSRL